MTSIDAIINRQILKWELEKRLAVEQPIEQESLAPIVTISRQSGSRGSYFGSRLAQKLRYQRLHREVIDVICRSSGYYRRIIESLDDHFRGDLELTVESMISGQSVDHADYFRYLYQVVLSMSHLGGVVLMGRGGNFILGPERGFHIRVVCPTNQRIENLVKYRECTEKEARRIIETSDAAREEFIQRLFHENIDNPTRYDLVINTALIDIEDLLEVACIALHAKINKLKHLSQEDS